MKRRIILVITDGWGVAPPGPGNYVYFAKHPNYDYFLENFPWTLNKAAGSAVGLPKGYQGNSEVGHLHIGAGRIVWQPLEKINREIRSGNFFKNKALVRAMKFVKRNDSKLHLMGLCSDEGVHAHINHLYALLKMAKKFKLKKVYIHFFGDGRDVPEKSAKKYVKMINNWTKKLKIGEIASVVGRYYSMDRDNNWSRTKKAYDMLVLGKGRKAKSAIEAINLAYKKGDSTDYYIKPTVIVKNGKPIATIDDKDAVIFFNYRTDRPRQLTQAFIQKNFKKFKREKWPKVLFVCFIQYKKEFKCPYAFKEEKIKNCLGEVLSKHKLKQLRLAETEKYAHVTYFFNGQVEKPFKGEYRIMVPSPKVPSYAEKPEMSAYKITEVARKEIETEKFDFILINFANCDLVGHSANKKAIIKAIETVDDCMGKVVRSGLNHRYTCIITSDHGSVEDKLYPNGKPKPSHSTNPVHFIIVSNEEELRKIKLRKGEQKDVAPTILELMKIPKPKEMTGKSLIK